MNKDQFDEIVERRTRKIAETLTTKAKEYAADDDRFHNFNLAARIAGTTPEKALKGMMLKHIVSVFDLIEWSYVDDGRLNEAIIDEKIGDTINYLILLEGMMKHQLSRKTERETYTQQVHDGTT